MSKTNFIKGFVFLCLLVFHYSLYAQCLGLTSSGFYTTANGFTTNTGKQPTASSNYFVNHVFSTFTVDGNGRPTGGSLNGNNFTFSASGGPNTSRQNVAPGETPVTGISFPATPTQVRVSTGSQGAKITLTFTSDLP